MTSNILAAQALDPTLALPSDNLDDLTALFARTSTKLSKTRMRQASCLVANLFVAWGRGGQAVYASRKVPYYSWTSRNTGGRITSTMIKVLDQLTDAGHIEIVKRGTNKHGAAKTRTIYRAGPDLVQLFEHWQAGHKFVHVPLVVLKCKDKLPMDYVQTDGTRRMASDLGRLNERLRSHEITLSGAPIDTLTRRVFNLGSFDVGGRFTAGYQPLKPDDRASILIDGEPTVELDFVAMQPCILHAMAYPGAGADIMEYFGPDPYGVEIAGVSDLRKAAKKMFLCLANSARPYHSGRVLWSFKHKVGADGIKRDRKLYAKHRYSDATLTAIIDGLIGRQPALRTSMNQTNPDDHPYAWHRLQRVESKLTSRVLMALVGQGIPVLGIHDSFIVRRTHQGQLIEAMRVAYHRTLGVEITDEHLTRHISGTISVVD